jgi:MFS family permease
VAAGLLLVWPGEYRLIFLLAAIPAIASLFVLLKYVRDVVPAARAVRGLPDVSLRDLGPAFPRYLGVLVVFTLGNATDAFLLLRAQDLGVAVPLIPILWGALHVSKMAWSVPGGMLSDRYPPQYVIIAGWAVYAVVYAGFAAASEAWHVWALFGVYGLFYGLTESPEKTLVAALAPDRLRARAFGTYHFAIGLGALPASLLFGVLWEAAGPAAAFLVGASLAVAAAALLPLALRDLTSSSSGNTP